MSEHAEHEEEQVTWQEGAEEDQEEDVEVPAEEEPQPNPSHEKIQTALQEIFELYQDAETSTIPVDRMVQILYAIGQPVPEGAASLQAFIEGEDKEKITLPAVQAYVATMGVETKGTAVKAATYSSLSQAKAFCQELFGEFDARESAGPARFTLGNVDAAQSGWAFHMDRRPSALEHYPVEANTTSVFSFSVRVRDASSEAFISAMATQSARLFSSVAAPLGNVRFRADTTRVHDDIVRVAYLIDVTDAAAFTLIEEIIEILSSKINAFSFTSQWGGSVDTLLTATLNELLCADVHITLDTLPIPKEFWDTIKENIVPLEDFGWHTLEDMYRDIPGLEGLLNGNMQATVDFTNMVKGLFDKLEAMMGGFLDIDNSSAMFMLQMLGPFLVESSFDGSSGYPPAAQIEGMSAAVEMMRLVVARDVTEFCGFEWRAHNGFGVRIDTNGIFKLDSIFGAVSNVLNEFGNCLKNANSEENAAEQLEGIFENLTVEEVDAAQQFPDESAFEEQ